MSPRFACWNRLESLLGYSDANTVFKHKCLRHPRAAGSLGADAQQRQSYTTPPKSAELRSLKLEKSSQPSVFYTLRAPVSSPFPSRSPPTLPFPLQIRYGGDPKLENHFVPTLVQSVISIKPHVAEGCGLKALSKSPKSLISSSKLSPGDLGVGSDKHRKGPCPSQRPGEIGEGRGAEGLKQADKADKPNLQSIHSKKNTKRNPKAEKQLLLSP